VTRSPRRERAIALPAALFVLMVVSALVGAMFYAALQEYRIGRNDVGALRALQAAQSGLDATLAGWDAARLNLLGAGEASVSSGALPAGTGTWVASIQRLTAREFLVRSTGTARGGAAWRTMAVVARLTPLELSLPGAIAASGAVTVGAGGLVDGAAADGGPDCATPDTAAGIAVADPASVSTEACGSGCVRGAPPVLADPALAGTVPVLGDSGLVRLAGLASLVLPPGASRALPSAADSALVVHATGDLLVDGGSWPGVMLVDGDLRIDGGARLSGLVVVRGRLSIGGAGGRVSGAVLAGGVELGSGLPGAEAAVVYSPCAVRRALLAVAPARPLPERAWAEVYQ
jgi:hypothetical protein